MIEEQQQHRTRTRQQYVAGGRGFVKTATCARLIAYARRKQPSGRMIVHRIMTNTRAHSHTATVPFGETAQLPDKIHMCAEVYMCV